MARYKLQKKLDSSDEQFVIKLGPPDITFAQDEINADYETYKKWLDAGNTPEAADYWH